jgi:plastocyanin
MREVLKKSRALWMSTLVACVLGAPVVLAGGSAGDLIVSQKNRQFNPQTITLNQGQALVIVNDDGDLMHHAYVESEAFNFDSGDQKPGSRTSVTFPTRGDFQVLCGIHPKMKLAVHVK